MVRCLIILKDHTGWGWGVEHADYLIWDDEKPLDERAKKLLAYYVRIGRIDRLVDGQYWDLDRPYNILIDPKDETIDVVPDRE